MSIRALLALVWILAVISLFSTDCLSTEETTSELPDITSLTLEELTTTDVISAAKFAQQAVDAPSAVSVVTAEEIRRFGYRTIGEILDSMRGIHITQDRQYGYLGGRGYGAPSEYAGRITLLIDGYSAAENYYHQIFINDDGYLDTALIDRVEYAPGPGSSIYGNNAFLGVVNIITHKGRDFNGLEVELTGGSHKDREGRFSWGERLESGAEWLISVSERRKNSVYSESPAADDISSERQFLKINYQNWSLEFLSANKQNEYVELDVFGDPTHIEIRDRNRAFNIGYETDFNQDWRSTVRLFYADYLFDYHDTFLDGSSISKTNGAWYGIDTKVIYLGLERQQLLFGAEYHVDSRQDNKSEYRFLDWLPFEFVSRNHGDILSVYGEDTITFSSSWSASIGGRYDRRRYTSLKEEQSFFNPRFALFYNPSAELSLKLSYGQASRFYSISDIETDLLYDSKLSDPQRVRTAELVAEHRKRGWRTLASIYRFRVDQLQEYLAIDYQDIKGVELESQWLWPGGSTLRGSYAWQRAKDDLGNKMPNVPRSIAKLQLSVPLLHERLRTSLAFRYVGKRKNLYEDDVKSYKITDLTLTSSSLYPDVNWTLAIRNVFDVEYGHVAYVPDESGLLEQDGRTLWLSLMYTPR